YVTVKVNGKSRVVLGEKANMTTVKDVLETGDIVLDPEDSVTPSLDSKVSESTVISINRANTTVETTDT
ncbi:ubiquitin-like domain-containing protein, partial [Erysipelatoclostridium ramosum]|nr:ubiquitin-like domain-containing protein [Thomasclavelia ramosa]